IEVQRQVSQDVGSAYAGLAAQQASLRASEERIRAARIAFEGVREEATLGARTTLDVLDAEQELLDAETSRISTQANLYVAAYVVLQATGRLTARDLSLGVQQYDPAAYYDLVKDAPVSSSAQGKKLDRVLRALQK
ncbi:MAG: TolC family protein, partial [Tateyamaria sp.]